MADRTNEEWLTDLQTDGPRKTQAIEELSERLQKGLYYYLRHERSDLSDRTSEDLQQMAADFSQDSLLKILDKIHTFRSESLFTTWASKIAVRVAISELRRARYKDYSLEDLTIDGAVMPDMTSLAIAPQEGPQPERMTEKQNAVEMIQYAIKHILTDRQRMALVAIVFEEIPMPEVARMMDTNRNALYKLLHDARFKMKTYFEEQGMTLDYVMKLFEMT